MPDSLSRMLWRDTRCGFQFATTIEPVWQHTRAGHKVVVYQLCSLFSKVCIDRHFTLLCRLWSKGGYSWEYLRPSMLAKHMRVWKSALKENLLFQGRGRRELKGYNLQFMMPDLRISGGVYMILKSEECGKAV